MKNVLASPSPPVRQSNEDQGRATGSSWRPVIVTPEEGLKSATSKTKAVPPTYAMEDEAVPPPLPVPEASELESQTVVLSGSTPKAIPRPKPAAVSEEGQNEALEAAVKEEETSGLGAATALGSAVSEIPQTGEEVSAAKEEKPLSPTSPADTEQDAGEESNVDPPAASAVSVKSETEGHGDATMVAAAASAVSEKAETEGEGDATMVAAAAASAVSEKAKTEGPGDEGMVAGAASAGSESMVAGVPAAADTEGAERQEKGFWHRDSKKCQRVWRPGSPRPKPEPVGLKLEVFPPDEAMEEVLCDDEAPQPLPARPESKSKAFNKQGSSAVSQSSKRPAATASPAEGPAAKARANAEWSARRKALEDALEAMDAERGLEVWLQRHGLSQVTDSKNEQTVLHLLAEDIRVSPQGITKTLISDVVSAASQCVNVVSGPNARPGGVFPLHQVCAGNDSGALRRFCCERLIAAAADLEARDARGEGL